MKIVYPSTGKLANYSYKNVYTDIYLKDNNPHTFFSEILNITSNTIKIQGNVTVYFNKYATLPELNVKTVNIHKGPAIIKANICTFREKDLPNLQVGQEIQPKDGYEFENKDIKLKVIEVTLPDIDPLTNKPKTLKVAGIDDYAPFDIPINIVEKSQKKEPLNPSKELNKKLTPSIFIPQGTKYLMTKDSSNKYIFPVAFNMDNTNLKVQIYKNTNVTKDSTSNDLGNLIYENVFFCEDKPMLFKSDIDFIFLDNEVTPNSLCKYSLVASTNTATEMSPIILKYAIVSVSQIN